MKLVSLVAAKKYLKDILSITYLNRRIDEVFINKASLYKVQKIETQLNQLHNALLFLAGELKQDVNPEFKKILSSTGEVDIGKAITFGKDAKFVFVCGLHRSGTTLITKLLQLHPEISGF